LFICLSLIKEKMNEKIKSSLSSPLAGCVILVVGGTGLSGSLAVRRLVALSTEDTIVRVMSRSANKEAIKHKLGAAVQVVKGDAADASDVRKAMLGVTHVFYLVGQTPSLSFLLSGKTVETALVTGLKNVLEEGRYSSASLRQVILLSAENCDRPWAPMSMFANNVAGYSQLMHVRQERLLREEAQRRTDFNYVIVRPSIMGATDVAPEPVVLHSIETPEGLSGKPTRSISRAALVEVMVHAFKIEETVSPGGVTFTLSSESKEPAPTDFDWKGLLDALPRDKDELPGADNDISHIHGRRVFITSVGTVLATVLVAVGFGLLRYFTHI
jgi:uncharacterized protein YbjT (DUF2867 family)